MKKRQVCFDSLLAQTRCLWWLGFGIHTGSEFGLDRDLIGGLKIKSDHPLSFLYQQKPSQQALTTWKEFIHRNLVAYSEIRH